MTPHSIVITSQSIVPKLPQSTVITTGINIRNLGAAKVEVLPHMTYSTDIRRCPLPILSETPESIHYMHKCTLYHGNRYQTLHESTAVVLAAFEVCIKELYANLQTTIGNTASTTQCHPVCHNICRRWLGSQMVKEWPVTLETRVRLQ